uniref:GNAT family N-acetyltransferase n=1 Tax=Atopococcus tabaci TaxID=269774 RepID=UPI002409220E
SLWTNSVHPNREYMGIFTKSENRRKGIGRQLYQQLSSLSESKVFQAAVSSKDSTAIAFLKDCGFQLARKCYTPVLQGNFSSSNDQMRYLSLNEATAEQWDELVALQLKNYRESHKAINALSDSISIPEWEKIITAYLDKEHSYLLAKGGKIDAYILCYEGEEPGEIEIGYVGGQDVLNLPYYTAFYKNAIHQLKRQFEKVSIEADDVDPFAFAALNLFEYDQSDSWDTYIIG